MSEDMRFVEWDPGELTRQDYILLDMVKDRSPDNLRKRFHEWDTGENYLFSEMQMYESPHQGQQHEGPHQGQQHGGQQHGDLHEGPHQGASLVLECRLHGDQNRVSCCVTFWYSTWCEVHARTDTLVGQLPYLVRRGWGEVVPKGI